MALRRARRLGLITLLVFLGVLALGLAFMTAPIALLVAVRFHSLQQKPWQARESPKYGWIVLSPLYPGRSRAG